MLATGEKTPTPARRAAPSSSPSTKKAREDVAPVPVPEAGAVVEDGLGRVEMPDASGGEIGMGGSGSGSTRTDGEAVGSALAILQPDLGGSCVANGDLWEVEAVGSPSVRAMT